MADPAHYQPPPNGWRTFLILWATQAFSVFGSMITQFTALAWLATVVYNGEGQQSQLSLATAAIGLADGLPMLFVAPIAGVWSDRYNRKTIMVVSNIVSGLLSLALVLLITANALQVWMLVVILGLLNVAYTFHGAAFEPTYVLLVPEKHLTRANGMTSTITSLSNILAPSIALVFLALPTMARDAQLPPALLGMLSGVSDGALLAFTIDMITFFVAAIVPLMLFIPALPRTESETPRETGIWAEFREGLQFIWVRRSLFWLLMTFAVTNLAVSTLSVFYILLVRFQLKQDWTQLGFSLEAALAFVSTSGAVGGVLGGILISAWGGLKRRRVYGVLGSMIIGGIALTIVGISPFLYLTGAMVFLLDLVNPIGSTHFRTLWQIQVPPSLQGRVVSVIRMIAQSSWPLGVLGAGVMGAVFDPGVSMMVIGALMTIFMITQLFNRTIMNTSEPPPSRDSSTEKQEQAGERSADEVEVADQPAAAV